MPVHPPTRNTIYAEQAEIVAQEAYEGKQYLLKLHAPKTARYALPGSFIHMQCGSELLMRRPMSIMRANAETGTIDVLYKVHGLGTELLSTRKAGEFIETLGPIGKPFKLDNYPEYPLLIGGGVGMPPMLFLAEHILKTTRNIKPFVILGSEIPFPFKLKPSKILVPGLPDEAIAAMPLLDDWGIPSRLTSLNGYPGCYQGYVTDLARIWLDKFDTTALSEVEIFSCGPTPMMEAVSRIASEYDIPCQVSLEEYMACAVGGCAGCTVLVKTDAGPAMQRVCVDGPVFDASCVFSFSDKRSRVKVRGTNLTPT